MLTGLHLLFLILVKDMELLVPEGFAFCRCARGNRGNQRGEIRGAFLQRAFPAECRPGIEIHIAGHAGISVGISGDLDAGGNSIADDVSSACHEENKVCTEGSDRACAGEGQYGKTMRKAVEGGMLVTDAFAKFGVL